MNLHRWLAAVFVMLAVAGCAQVAMRQRQPPYAPYSSDPNEGYLREKGWRRRRRHVAAAVSKPPRGGYIKARDVLRKRC